MFHDLKKLKLRSSAQAKEILGGKVHNLYLLKLLTEGIDKILVFGVDEDSIAFSTPEKSFAFANKVRSSGGFIEYNKTDSPENIAVIAVDYKIQPLEFIANLREIITNQIESYKSFNKKSMRIRILCNDIHKNGKCYSPEAMIAKLVPELSLMNKEVIGFNIQDAFQVYQKQVFKSNYFFILEYRISTNDKAFQ